MKHKERQGFTLIELMVVVDLQALDHVFPQHAFGQQVAEERRQLHPARINFPQLALCRFLIARRVEGQAQGRPAGPQVDVAVIEGEEALAVLKAGVYAYRDRRANKRNFRQLWQIQINAAVRPLGLSYSQFIQRLKKSNIVLDRKVLAQLAQREPQTFTALVSALK